MGGWAGSGGFAQNVTLDAAGSIFTEGSAAHGILAQSIGGSGGNGGFAASAVFGISGEKTNHNLAISVGGGGGSGNVGGEVYVRNLAMIQTTGSEAIGIFAQSLGGGGGTGGGSFTGIVGAKGSGEGKVVNANITVGGKGGSGAISKLVDISHSGGIHTTGNGSDGIRAQSIGGGGGAGGQANSLSLILGQKKKVSTGDTEEAPDKEKSDLKINLAIGGFGGTGNDANTVKVVSDDLIWTTGISAHGINAQSIGGGGGTGGHAALGTDELLPFEIPIIGEPDFILEKLERTKVNELEIAIGGSGGAAGAGKLIDITNKGNISVEGKGSWAIFAQSIGGGGGTGGNALAGKSGKVGIGGGRLDGILGVNSGAGDGGKVVVNNEATSAIFATGSMFSGGIFAQSVGGGGGQGGAGSGRIDIGGNAGSTGNGLEVEVTNRGTISTTGDFSSAIFAQSVGGGGGTGGGGALSLLSLGGNGSSGGDGGTVDIFNFGRIDTFGNVSHGVFAQSVGGGGGTGGGREEAQTPIGDIEAPNLVSLGGSGGGAGDSKNVLIENSAMVNTSKEFSIGLLAQSIAGGGGFGGDGLGAVVLGGKSGASGSAGTATIRNKVGGAIKTIGDYSVGIFAQSVGGGGGMTAKSLGIVTIGRNGSDGGNGAMVLVENDGTVETTGNNASAIVAQSVGGGGGYAAGATGIATFGADAGNGGNGGEVTVISKNTIKTSGENSHGIFAQSIGGGGGVVNDSGSPIAAFKKTGSAGDAGNAKRVTVKQTGDITATGDNSFAILVQSEGGTSNGDLDVEIVSGTVQGGSSTGAGVGFLDGATNKLTNRGTLKAAGDIAGLAVFGEQGDETIDNFGTMMGNVALGLGTNLFDNKIAARLEAGLSINLGNSAQLFKNVGFFAPGGTGFTTTVLTSELNGSLKQESQGAFEVDLDFVAGDAVNGLADRINVSGTAELNGEVDLFIVNPNKASPGYRTVTILNATGDVTVPELVLDAPASAVTKYDILYPDLNNVELSYEIDFSPTGLNGNQTAIGDFVNNLQLAGGTPTLDPFVGTLFVIETLDELQKAYDSLSPEAYATNLTTSLVGIDNFNNSMMSCRRQDGNYRFVSEENCLWLQVSRMTHDYDGNSENFDYHEKTNRIVGGFQGNFAENWYLGIAGSFETPSGKAGPNATSEGTRRQAGMVLKYRHDATTLAASVVGGKGSFDTMRTIDLGSVGGVAFGTQDIKYVSTHLRISHLLQASNVYALPTLDIGATHMRQDGFTETGGGLVGLTVDERAQTYWAITPSIEFGGEFQVRSAVVRPKIKVGAVYNFGGDDPSVAAGLSAAAGVPGGVPSFVTKAGRDKYLGFLEGGFDVVSEDGMNFRMAAGIQKGNDTQVLYGSVKFALPF